MFSEEQVGECQTNLLKVVCDKYTGPNPKPDACSNAYISEEGTSSKIGVSKL